MIVPANLIESALAVFEQPVKLDEIALRRAISAAYYGLFHKLVDAAARVVVADDPELQPHIVRAYNHCTIKRVCEELLKQPEKRQALGPLLSSVSNKQLLHAPISRIYAQGHVESAASACSTFETVRHRPDTRRFLIALLIADRYKQRG